MEEEVIYIRAACRPSKLDLITNLIDYRLKTRGYPVSTKIEKGDPLLLVLFSDTNRILGKYPIDVELDKLSGEHRYSKNFELCGSYTCKIPIKTMEKDLEKLKSEGKI